MKLGLNNNAINFKGIAVTVQKNNEGKKICTVQNFDDNEITALNKKYPECPWSINKGLVNDILEKTGTNKETFGDVDYESRRGNGIQIGNKNNIITLLYENCSMVQTVKEFLGLNK